MSGNGLALPISVYRAAGRDCTNGGVSAQADELLLIGETVEGFVNVNDRQGAYAAMPVVMLVKGHLRGTARIIPVQDGPERWVMFGGNYGATSDARFNAALWRLTGSESYGAVPIHDRIEG